MYVYQGWVQHPGERSRYLVIAGRNPELPASLDLILRLLRLPEGSKADAVDMGGMKSLDVGDAPFPEGLVALAPAAGFKEREE